MKTYLIDENLPAAIAGFLDGPGRLAVEWGRQLPDGDLWNLARGEKWIIITRDADFFFRLAKDGPPPKIVWIRFGNFRRAELLDRLRDMWPRITKLLQEADLVEVREGRLEGLAFR